MDTIYDICYSKLSNQYLDVYLPDSKEFIVVIYFHGGGLSTGDKSHQKNLFYYLVSHGLAVVSVNYRLYPNAKYPDFLVDAAEAVAWVFNNFDQYGVVKGVFVGGSSAGGYLSQMLCFDKRWLLKHGISGIDISGFFHDAGQPTCHFNILKERGIDNRRIIVDDSSPLYHVGEDEKYSPMLIIVSDNDIPNRYEQTMLLLSTLKHFGYSESIKLKVMHGNHCGYIDAINQNGESVFGQLILEFILDSNKNRFDITDHA